MLERSKFVTGSFISISTDAILGSATLRPHLEKRTGKGYLAQLLHSTEI